MIGINRHLTHSRNPYFTHNGRAYHKRTNSNIQLREFYSSIFSCQTIIYSRCQTYSSSNSLTLNSSNNNFWGFPTGINHSSKTHKKFFSTFKIINSNKLIETSSCTKGSISSTLQNNYFDLLVISCCRNC